MGRLYGEMVDSFGWSDSQPGVYSLIGAAAVLGRSTENSPGPFVAIPAAHSAELKTLGLFSGGMSRMTISLTVILIEATNDSVRIESII